MRSRKTSNAMNFASVFFAASLFSLPVFSAQIKPSEARPNVILITIDNHHTSVLGFAGNRLLETPHIDQLRREGVFFSNYRTASRCSASRAAMMTGRYHLRSGAIGTGDARSTMGALDQPTVANLFQDAGYKTGMFGKWHMGANYPFRPEDRGFREVVSYGPDSSTLGLVIGEGGKAATKHKFRHNGKWEVFDGYRTDVWFDALGRFVEKNEERPFFAYLATWSTHGPNLGPVGLSEKYKKKLKTLNGVDAAGFLADEKKAAFLELAAEMDVIDRRIGKLLNQLEELGIRERTIIVYTSDGSGSGSPSELMAPSCLAHESVCPALINWPQNIAPNREVTELIANIDMTPTLLDLCGIKPTRPTDFDGQSAAGLLLPKETPWKTRVYVADHQSKAGDRRVILRPLDDTTVYLPQGSVHFRDGIALNASPEIEKLARTRWSSWWKEVTADFEPYQYAVVGTENVNPMFLRQAYTESAADEPVKRYVMAVEFARNGDYVFSALYDAPYSPKPNQEGTSSSEGYLKIDDDTFAGAFPMKRRVSAGKHLLRVSLDGKRTDSSVRIELVGD